MIIGDRLRAIREKKGLSQRDLGQPTGIQRTYISRVENGHTVPSLENLKEIASALGVPLHELFYDSGNPPLNFSHLSANHIARNYQDESRKAGLVSHLFSWLLGKTNVDPSRKAER
jgi:transcriptional regulator with XRE-family HTH domain